MTARLAIDPGGVHVGWALSIPGADPGYWAGEWTVTEAIARVREFCQGNGGTDEEARELVIEEYRLYPGVKQEWSSMETSQLIGKLKLIAEDAGIPWLEQGANIKKPTQRQLRARGIKLVGRGTHARDAELHLWYRKLRAEGVTQ